MCWACRPGWRRSPGCSRARQATGRPAATVRSKPWPAPSRAGQGSAGLPVAVQVAAAPWREDIVLALLMALERDSAARPDYPGRPPLLLA